MKEITITVPDGKKAEWVNGVLTLIDEEVKDKRPVMERIKSFEDAMAVLGESHPLVIQYKENYDNFLENGGDGVKDIVAYLKLRIIVAALNEGWEPQFTEDEDRWYPWFVLYSADELAEKSDEWKAARVIVPLDNYRVVGRSSHDAGAGGGLVCANADGASSSSNTGGGSRLAFKTEALANYAARQFADLWADFYLIRK